MKTGVLVGLAVVACVGAFVYHRKVMAAVKSPKNPYVTQADVDAVNKFFPLQTQGTAVRQ